MPRFEAAQLMPIAAIFYGGSFENPFDLETDWAEVVSGLTLLM